jgi:hypothetical protein
LEGGNLFDELRLAGAQRGGEQRVHVIEDAHGGLQPVALGATQLGDLELQMLALDVLGLFEKGLEALRLRTDAVADFLRRLDGPVGLLVGVLPEAGHALDPAGHLFELVDAADGVGQVGPFGARHLGAVPQYEGPYPQPGAQRRAGGGGGQLVKLHRPVGLVVHQPRGGQEDDVADKKGGVGGKTGRRALGRFAHGNGRLAAGRAA